MGVSIKTDQEIKLMREAGKIAAESLAVLKDSLRAGMTTSELDAAGEELILKRGAEPVFKGYRGYKHATCISVNSEVVHGIPGGRLIKDGDIVSIDVGVRYKGYCGDNAATFAVGAVSGKASKLIRACREALKAGIKQARAGRRLGDVSSAIQKVSEKHGFSVVRELYGHGIGRDLHEDPLVPNFGFAGEGIHLRAGMIIAIEPMLNTGSWRIKTLNDGWTVVTEDGGLSSHFEHTVVITDGDPEILTIW
ncbi:type I methionyl aminopeptidase [candidate division WOR-1 bacterium RIFOXYA12_FULL_52_29]|uniref:Methionine aminopeptidase n=1 Tax=candidate division WOR-1 bacterium RIFOXYC12_FULL_54_18 TaxID=1802584 RepID=A0A1F4T606_UNCSA|nr:MAG: type I methionyl aminopeptidase [candidate division WOR-1 bacterium RIFOXYA2_FULL_51_19]OGC17570.1 MAG: type I methionyl aminopeptidase [candidate division WOR-1 bacterium RIFOXYA12_FULL_52_29]OGC26427.1 MAG: type I methionyl aminopeptidase [candidate division WOR-1 bacterium RIFOXYB2_FULL_45_9]OGC27987.1 MAG: type I methionyl aminopeptidase [candidate division WOR-1 bacterium RIFOXYC12_FULL_54_18]OGC29727.1 MAG: type I methionyl aminopeptidase [candidate division WOR-1 bacterium RIFOXY